MHKQVARLAAAAIFVVAGLWAHKTQGQGPDFDYGVDRAEYDGCGFGAKDGTPDLTYEFDTPGDFSPWTVDSGTVTVEADGHLHLKSPGDLLNYNGVNLYRSQVLHPGTFSNTVACERTVTWTIDSEDLVTGTSFASLLTCEGNAVAVGSANYNADDGGLIGIPAGLRTFVTQGPGTIVGNDSFDESDVTAQVITRQSWGAGDTDVKSEISLNGGVSWRTYTTSLFVGGCTTANDFIYADPAEDSGPEPTPTCEPPPTPAPRDREVCYKGSGSFPMSSIMAVADAIGFTADYDIVKVVRLCVPANIMGAPNDPTMATVIVKARARSHAPNPSPITVQTFLGPVTVDPKKPVELSFPAQLP